MTDAAVTYRGRFAPSPTGPLHFGSLIAAMASYCDARAAAGEWLVRIEDVDEPRSREAAADAILATLERYGFEWDGEVVRQSERIALYEAALAGLIARGEAYACVCTRKELELCTTGPGGERVYPGTCRGGAPTGREARAWRVVVNDEPVAFRDRLQGWIEQRLEREIGDFIVKRADGVFAYQLAVVVDDAAQGVTHVVRGADLLASTPRQIRLQRALRLPTPAYLHHPVAILASGEKLSKQIGATALPVDPILSLLQAWSFLGQQELSAAPLSAAEFWRWALRHWSTARMPPVAMLPVAPVAGPLAV